MQWIGTASFGTISRPHPLIVENQGKVEYRDHLFAFSAAQQGFLSPTILKCFLGHQNNTTPAAEVLSLAFILSVSIEWLQNYIYLENS